MKRVTVAEAKQLQEQGYTYLDVRTEGEFAAGHPVGAVNLPINAPNFVQAVKATFNTDAKLVVGCQVGGRSARAVEALEAQGFSQLICTTGWEDWSAQKLPGAKGT